MTETNRLISQSSADQHQMINEKTIDLSLAVFKSALLINGGAAVAVLGFSASVIKESVGFSLLLDGVAGALMCFTWGVASSVLGIGAAYFSMFFSAKYITIGADGDAHRSYLSARLSQALAIALAAASIGLFLFGAYEVKEAVAAYSVSEKGSPLDEE